MHIGPAKHCRSSDHVDTENEATLPMDVCKMLSTWPCTLNICLWSVGGLEVNKHCLYKSPSET